jgi:hypothetical protein
MATATATNTSTDTAFTYKRPPLYDKQLEAIFCDERYGIVEASTKSGKTHGCIAWIFERAVSGKPGQNFWWVAPVYGQTKIAYRRLKRALKYSVPKEFYHQNDSDFFIHLNHFDTTIWFKSADKPDSLYGEDVYAAVIDEASRCKEDSWYAIRTTLSATRGPIRMIGNVKGRKNWAYKLARRAEMGEENMHFAKITAYDAADAGVLDVEEIEDARSVLPEDVFKELYLCVPSDDGGNPFGLTAIAACVKPISDDPPVVWGWDLAKSRDWTVGVALDRDGHVCGFHRWQAPWSITEGRILNFTERVPALVDSTGVGDPVVESLQKAATNYANTRLASMWSNFEGFKFTGPSKQQLMDGLRVAIQDGRIGFPDGLIRQELDNFEYEYTKTGVRYSAPEGFFDDCVMALALAWRQLSTGSTFYGTVAPISFTRASPWKIQ